jgi:hypothetical protein
MQVGGEVGGQVVRCSSLLPLWSWLSDEDAAASSNPVAATKKKKIVIILVLVKDMATVVTCSCGSAAESR